MRAGGLVPDCFSFSSTGLLSAKITEYCIFWSIIVFKHLINAINSSVNVDYGIYRDASYQFVNDRLYHLYKVDCN